ncbi:MAG: hypothetical protein K2P58_09720 [Hyphomonadaceae bacterium]|nr:hypothetical protein [Hyphomonadaceae bacterium]
MSGERPSGLPRVRPRLPFEPVQSPLTGQTGKLFLLALLMAACVAAAAYMLLVARMPWTDMRVVGPAIGALWFGLRIFMNLTPKL